MTTAKPNPHKGYILSSFYYNMYKIRSNTLKLIPNACVTKENYHRIKTKKLLPLTALMFAVLGVNSAHAAISATTAQTIQGSKPALSAALVADINAGNDFELLGLDVGGNQYFTASDIAARFPSGIGAYTPASALTQLGSGTPVVAYNIPSTTQASDSDGDGFTTGALTGSASIVGWFYNNGGTETALTAAEIGTSFCDLAVAGKNPYLKLQGPVTLQTQYGDPNSEVYDIAVTGSPIHATSNNPVRKFTFGGGAACYAQPNLNYGAGKYAGSPTQWNPTKGFLPQTSPNRNFPTTGFYGAWFNLTVAGTTAASIINKMDSTAGGSPLTGYVTSGDVKLKLVEASTNVVNITLYGPRDANVTTQTEAGPPTGKFKPGQFSLRDGSGTTVYTFKIDKWFITRNVYIAYSTGGSIIWSSTYPYGFNGNLETPSYCANLGGTGKNWYRVPARSSYTNSAVVSKIAYNGSASSGGAGATNNYYRRTIGEGFFTEWGMISDGPGAYPLSEFRERDYWASEPYGVNSLYVVGSDNGRITGSTVYNIGGYAACESF